MTIPTRKMSGQELSAQIRRRVLDLSYRAHVGHIGSCLSVADILGAVYASSLFDWTSMGSDRDRFVLGKGHAGLALFAALEAIGIVPAGQLDTFGRDGVGFGVHPEHHLPGVDFSTGSLGQGLGMAAGAALAARIQRSDRKTVAVLSDAECNAGSTWEAAQFAGHHRLANLVAIIDVNGQQALGATRTILDQEPWGERWRVARWEVRDIDGHNHGALADALQPSSAGPVAVVARTTFGKGVSFMERQLDWHYQPMNAEQYEVSLRGLESSDAD